MGGERFSRCRAVVGTCLLALATSLYAAPFTYRIDAGSLDQALRAFARQSGAQLLYAPELTASHRSGGLHGPHEPAQALTTLLRGSGLRAVTVNGNTYLIEAIPPVPKRRPASPVPAPPPIIRPVALRAVDVTGLDLRRNELETSSPQTVIERRQIEYSGYQTLYDLLRAQPGMRVSNAPVAMSDGAAYQNIGVAGATGAAAVGLHGLGSSATVFLIDGQRLAGYGLAQDDFSITTDLSSIPLALVDHVEILRDGPSTIYGTDAAAGVVNVVLRKQAPGLNLSGSYGLSARGDASQRRSTASLGGDVGGGHLLVSADYLDRAPLLGAQRGWAQTPVRADLASGGDALSDGTYYLEGARIVHAAGTGCATHDLADPARCDLGPTHYASLQTALQSRALYAHYDVPLGAAQFYTDMRWTRVLQRQQSAPATQDVEIMPDYPGNVQRKTMALTYAFDDLGPVRDATSSTGNQYTLGLKGPLGAWDWDVHAGQQRNRSTDSIDGLLRTSTLVSAVGSDAYRFDAADNPSSLLRQISPTLHRNASITHDEAGARITGPLFQSAAGPATLTAGLSRYQDRLRDDPDPLLLDNDVFQFNSPSIRRSLSMATAAYAQLDAPLGRSLEATVGWRLQDDRGYGFAAKPKLGLRWKLGPSLSLRASWAAGRRVPTAIELERPSLRGEASFATWVPASLSPCRQLIASGADAVYCALRLDDAGNSKLRPETSHYLDLGLLWSPSQALGLTLDIYRIDIGHQISPIPLSYAIWNPGSYPQVFQRDRAGQLVALNPQLVNLGYTHLQAFSLDMRRSWDTARRGRFLLNLGMDYLQHLDRQVVPGGPALRYAGYASQPRLSALAGLEWSYRDWSVAANLRYTGYYRYAPYAGAESYLACPGDQAGHCDTPAFAILDLNLAYAGFAHWTLGFNVHNALDHQPVYYGDPGNEYNPLFDDVVGRYFLVSFSYRY